MPFTTTEPEVGWIKSPMIRSSVDLPQPRTGATREDPRFFELVTRVREALHMGAELERAEATA